MLQVKIAHLRKIRYLHEIDDTLINKARIWIQKGVFDKDNIAKNSLIAPVIHKRYKQSRKDSTKNRY